MKKTSRTFKRFAAITSASLLAACMVAPMAGSAAKITIKNEPYNDDYTVDEATHTYEAYQIFSGTLNEGVLSAVQWGTGLKENKDDVLNVVKNITLSDLSKPFEECDSAKAVAEILAEANDDDEVVQAFASKISTVLGTKTGTSENGIIDGLSNGYYLVQDTSTSLVDAAKTRYILEVAGDIEVKVKSSFPTVMKKVYEETLDDETNEEVDFAGNEKFNPGSGFNDVADYDVGDSVKFKLYGTLPSSLADYSTYKYKFIDSLGTEFNNPTSLKITVDNEGTENDKVFNVTYSDGQWTTSETGVTVNDNTPNGFIVEFSDIKTNQKATKNTIVTIEYDAVLNEGAKIGYTGQVNGVKLQYSNNPNVGGENELGTTTDDGVIVFTYGFDINKVISGTSNKLEGAKFAIYYKDDDKDVYIKTDEKNIYDGDLVNAPTEDTEVNNSNGVWQSEKDANIIIKGLDKDKVYYIKELAPPAQYNPLDADVEVKIDSTLKSKSIYQQNWTYNTSANAEKDALDAITVNNSPVDDDDDDLGTITIGNSKGSTLPGTGGIGTTVFYLGGGAMVAVAGIYLISKKRMKNTQE